jgi:hypothetical protein
MRVLFVWENARVKESGITSSVLKANSCFLAPDSWVNLDHYRTAPVIDCFCLSATRREIENHLLPRIGNYQHKAQCILPYLHDEMAGLPFFVSRDLHYIQRINRMPWMMKGEKVVACPPFFETNIQIGHPERLIALKPTPLTTTPTGHGIPGVPGYGPLSPYHLRP